MYKIVFHDIGNMPDEVYGGGTYVVNGEKYAVFNDQKPKLYKSEKVAMAAARKLLVSCVNAGVSFSVVEV